jgi:hypothetical protein
MDGGSTTGSRISPQESMRSQYKPNIQVIPPVLPPEIPNKKYQCCGSGSVGFVCFGLLDPDPLVRGTDPDPEPDLFYHQAKK